MMRICLNSEGKRQQQRFSASEKGRTTNRAVITAAKSCLAHTPLQSESQQHPSSGGGHLKIAEPITSSYHLCTSAPDRKVDYAV